MLRSLKFVGVYDSAGQWIRFQSCPFPFIIFIIVRGGRACSSIQTSYGILKDYCQNLNFFCIISCPFMLTIVSALGNLVTTFKMFLFPFPPPLTWNFVNNWSALSFASLESYFFIFGGGARVWVKTSFLGSSNAHHPLLLLGLWSIISALK